MGRAARALPKTTKKVPGNLISSVDAQSCLTRCYSYQLAVESVSPISLVSRLRRRRKKGLALAWHGMATQLVAKQTPFHPPLLRPRGPNFIRLLISMAKVPAALYSRTTYLIMQQLIVGAWRAREIGQKVNAATNPIHQVDAVRSPSNEWY